MEEKTGKLNRKLDFSEPKKVIDFLTSEDKDYAELLDVANELCGQIETPHTNLDGQKFHTISQCILECFKRLCGFNSTKWVSDKKLDYELKTGENFITFTRINAKQEKCLYKIANFDQIDFESGFADEYEVINGTESVSNTSNSSGAKDEKTYVIPKSAASYFKKSPEKEPEPAKEDDATLKKINDFLRNGDNVFVTGHAGTGKSYILRKLKEKYKKNLTITSTTGIAAVNVKGQTLHSWAGVGLCRNTIAATVEKIKTRSTQCRQIKNCKMLAIDEISMLNVETFEYVNEVLKQIRENDAPFGGIQVIFIGDFFQLPPVEKGDVGADGQKGSAATGRNGQRLTNIDADSIKRKYCFETGLWQDLNLKNVVLKKNYRQNEEKFINALSNMRINRLNDEDIELFSTRSVTSDTSGTNILHIFSTNEEANNYNSVKFNALERKVTVFNSKDGVYRGKELVFEDFNQREEMILEIFNKSCRADKEIALKIGCKVMLLVNMDFDKGLINGACGTVQKFNNDTINITFDNGVNANIPLHEFEYYYNDAVVAVRRQYPLKLAYGITIHKSQGMTLNKLVVDCKRIFERGQVYVAMSRVKSLDGLYLKSFDPEKVLCDEKVAEFYEQLEESPALNLPDEPRSFGRPKSYDDSSDTEIKALAADFVKEYDGLYGKSGISKILTGSKAIKVNDYNEKILLSRYYGAVTGRTRKAVDEIIAGMIEDNILTIKHVSFGRPVLCFNRGRK